MEIALHSINHVKEFAKIILESGVNVTAISGKYRVNAGSVMGLFSLDLTKPIELEFSEDSEDLKEKLVPFTINSTI